MWFDLSFFIRAIQALLVPGYFAPTCKAHGETNGENNEISKSRFVFIIMVTVIIIILIAILIIAGRKILLSGFFPLKGGGGGTP